MARDTNYKVFDQMPRRMQPSNLSINYIILQLYGEEGARKLARLAFDRARSIDPSFALPWAGMSADIYARELNTDDAYESCLRAVQILPLAEFQIGLARLALLAGHISASQVLAAIQQAVQRAPYHPESHNMNGIVSEARFDYQSAAVSYRLARFAINNFAGKAPKSHLRDISINLARSLCKAGNALGAVQECEALYQQGLLDLNGMQIYALSLWQLGKNDKVLTVVKKLAASAPSMEQPSRDASVGLICRLLYYISGLESTVNSILKMSNYGFQSSKISFIISAIHAMDKCNQLESVVSGSRCFLASQDDFTRTQFLIGLSKLIKHGCKECIGIQSGVIHLRRVLHIYPNSDLIRNLLGYLHLLGKEWEDGQIASRCFVIRNSECMEEEGLKSAYEILGASAVYCYSSQIYKRKYTFPTCECECLHERRAIRQLQKLLHQEPWNYNARYLLIINYLQEAREQRFPKHLCHRLGRLTDAALSNRFYSKKDKLSQYQLLQLQLCASEISLQAGDSYGCISHAKIASELLLPDSYIFFAHLQLCRAYAAESNFSLLCEEYNRCLDIKTDYPIGWICLKFIEAQYELQTHSNMLQLCYDNCLKGVQKSFNISMAMFSLVQGLIAIWRKDFQSAEELLAQACSLAGAERCLFLCHGAICMELARQLCDPRFISLAIRSLKKAKETSVISLPIVSVLLAQAEASLGSKMKWEQNLRLEWFSWPPEMRPAELFLQMHLLSRESKDSSDSHPRVESTQSPQRWILRAIHLNPSCLRYWKVRQILME
ncbi:hypothetical protein NMG60_11015921 [Bertholletia excelsa]